MDVLSSFSLTRTRAVVLAGAVALLIVVVIAVAGRGGPPTIVLTSSPPAFAEAAEADDARAGAITFEFELADGARFGAGAGSAWQLEPPTDLRGAAAALADRFGLGTPVATPHGGYEVSDAGGGAHLWVGPSGEWYYGDRTGVEPADCVDEVVAPVEPEMVDPDVREPDGVEPDRAEPDAVEPGDRAEPDAVEPGDADDPDVVEPDVVEPDAVEPDAVEPADDEDAAGSRPLTSPCPEPTPPTGVPDAAEARLLADRLFADLDLALGPVVTEVHADEWGAWVHGHLSVDGRPTDLVVSVSFGGDGAVVAANGTLARPTEVGEYPTVDADTALERLRTQGGWAGSSMPVIDPAEVVEDAGRPDEPVSSSLDEPVDDVATIMPAPEADAENATVVVRLVAAEPVLSVHHGADGTVWLLPAVRFTDEAGGAWQVMTVADGYVEFAEPELLPADPEPEPLPEQFVEPPDEPAPGEPGR